MQLCESEIQNKKFGVGATILNYNGSIVNRLRWWGHIERTKEKEIPKHIYKQIPDRRRNRGRTRTRFKDQVEKHLRT